MSSAAPKNPSRMRLVTNKKCPFAQKVWIALEEYAGPKGYELEEVSLYGGNGKPSWFMAINPAGQVPVLWLPSGRIITESDDIIDYLITLPDRKSGPNPLTPPSAEVITKWRSLLSPFLRSARNRCPLTSKLLYTPVLQAKAPDPTISRSIKKLSPLLRSAREALLSQANCYISPYIRPNPLIPPSAEALTKWRSLLSPFLRSARKYIESSDWGGLSSLLYKLDKQCPEPPSPYLGGSSFSAVDATVLPFIQRLVEEHEDMVQESSPKLWTWWQEVSDRPTFRRTKVSPRWMWW